MKQRADWRLGIESYRNVDRTYDHAMSPKNKMSGCLDLAFICTNRLWCFRSGQSIHFKIIVMKMMILISHCSRKIEDNDEDNNLLAPFQGIDTYAQFPPMQIPRWRMSSESYGHVPTPTSRWITPIELRIRAEEINEHIKRTNNQCGFIQKLDHRWSALAFIYTYRLWWNWME